MYTKIAMLYCYILSDFFSYKLRRKFLEEHTVTLDYKKKQKRNVNNLSTNTGSFSETYKNLYNSQVIWVYSTALSYLRL